MTGNDTPVGSSAPEELAPIATLSAKSTEALTTGTEPSEQPEAPTPTAPDTEPSKASKKARLESVQPVLEQLFTLYPQLFGAQFLPLKLGVFQEILATHPEVFSKDSLKAALGVHTRSTRYLQSVAAGNQRHDLQGQAVAPVAPEHVALSILELYRRRQGRPTQRKDDPAAKAARQLIAAFEASGLERQEFLARITVKDEACNALIAQAFELYDQQQAKTEALRRAFLASNDSAEAFAAMYGLNPSEVSRLLTRSDASVGAA